MKKRTKILTFYSVLWAAVYVAPLANAAAAQSIFPPKLDLESAVGRALESDPRVHASQTLSKIASVRIEEARTGLRPTVELNQSFTRSNNPVFVFSSLLEQGRFKASDLLSNSLNQP